jgi:hypothetical protein
VSVVVANTLVVSVMLKAVMTQSFRAGPERPAEK